MNIYILTRDNKPLQAYEENPEAKKMMIKLAKAAKKLNLRLTYQIIKIELIKKEEEV